MESKDEKNRKKVGIVTFFEANNFGVCLQALATEKYLCSIGYDAEIINYINPYEHRQFKVMYKENNRFVGYFISLAKNILLGKYYYYRKGFGNVKESFNLSAGSYNMIEGMKDLDYYALVAGSDQIWNGEITGKLDPVFLLQFGKANKRISIASSLGSKKPSLDEQGIFKDAFANFTAISVREKFAKVCLESCTNKDIKVLMDPTFLFCREEWMEMLAKKSKYYNLKERYILTYFIAKNKSSYKKRVKEYSEKLGLPVWSIQFSNYYWEETSRRIMGITIEDFIAIMGNASLVLTDSFHGTAFSVNLQRNFVPFRHSGNPVRVIDLLQKIGIEQRLDMEAKDYCEVDYSSVNPELERLRMDSKRWIENALVE